MYYLKNWKLLTAHNSYIYCRVLTLSIGYTANKKYGKQHKVGNTGFLTPSVVAQGKLIIGQNKTCDSDHPNIQY